MATVERRGMRGDYGRDLWIRQILLILLLPIRAQLDWHKCSRIIPFISVFDEHSFPHMYFGLHDQFFIVTWNLLLQ